MVQPASFSRSSAIYSGVVPQQPPYSLTPSPVSSAMLPANSSAVMSYPAPPGSGRPALGLMAIGRVDHRVSSRTSGGISRGPREQFTPMASAPIPSRVRAAEAGSQPRKVRPRSS